MDYKEKFIDLLDENKFDEARLVLEENKLHANEDPFYYGNMGWVLNHMERYKEAEFYLLKGVYLFEEEGWIHSQLGFCYNRLEKFENGLNELKKALEYGFNEKWIYGEMGWCLKQLNMYEEAIYIFEDALMDNANNPWIISQAADIYYLLGKKDIALEYFLKSYYLKPDSDACIDIANFYHEEKDYLNEIKYLSKIDNKEDQAWAKFQIASAYVELEKYDTALQYLNEAKICGKDDTSLHELIGDVYGFLDEDEKANEHYNIALSYYENALLIEHEHDWIYQQMIWIAHKQKDWNKKLSYLKRADKEKEDDLWLMYHFARCYTDLQKYDQAIQACEFCLKHNEQSKDMVDLYAWNLGRNKEEEKAIEILQFRIKKYGNDTWSYAELGWSYVQLEEYSKALDSFLNAYELDQTNAYHTSMIGYCYYSLLDYNKSLEYFTKSINLGRCDAWIYISIGETLEILKREKEALFYYEKAKELGYSHEFLDKKIHDLKEME